ncbi:MAG: hypothetical protein R6W71_10220 [Bacteroidales bacterium]
MRLLISLLMVGGLLSTMAQQAETRPSGHELCDVPLIFDQPSFGDRFSVMAISENEYDYYVVDLSKLPGRFERIYFLNLTYQTKEVVNIDPDIYGQQMWFKAYRDRQEQDVSRLFEKMKEESLDISRTMPAEEKAAWLSKYDKYKNPEVNE